MSMITSKAKTPTRDQQLRLRLAIAMICAGATTMHASDALADTAAEEATAEQSGGISELIVTGSRTSGLKAADSPAPVQIFSAEALQKAAGDYSRVSA